MNKTSYLGSIDGLRAISITLVFLYHLVPQIISGGFLGVDVFFVISGYVISKSLFEERNKTGKFELIKFYIRRFKRIFPILFLVTTFSILLYFKFGYLSQNQRIIETALTALVGISNLYFLKENADYFLLDTINPLEHTWSLGVEEQFYLFYPTLLLLLYFVKNRIKIFLKQFPLFFIFFLSVISFFIFFFSNDDFLSNFYSPIARSWQLMLGALLYIGLFSEDKFSIKLNSENIFFTNLIIFLTLFLIIILSLWYFSETNFRAGTVVISILTVIIIFFLQKKQNFILLDNKIIIFLGKISFSVYLWHFPIIYLTELYFDGLSFYFFSVICTLLISSFSYLYVENPIRTSNLFLNLGKKKLYSIILAIFVIFIVAVIFRIEIRSNLSNLNSLPVTFNYFNKKIESLNFDENRLTKIYDFKGISAHAFCRENMEIKIKDIDALKKLNCMHVNGKSNKLIILLGDSHSFHYLPGMKSLFKNYNFYHSYVPCLFSDKFASISRIEPNKNKKILECLTGIDNMILKIRNFEKNYGEGSIQIVISQRLYSRLIEMDVYDEKSNRVYDKKSLYIIYYENLKSIISKFKSTTKVFLIMPTPDFRNIQGISLICILKKRNFCEIKKTQVKKKFKKIYEIYNKIDKEFANVSTIDNTDKLCPKQTCKVYDKNIDKLFYSDNNHLSLEFSETIGIKINNIIKKNDN